MTRSAGFARGWRRRASAFRLGTPEVLESRALLADGISPTAAPALHAVAGVPLSNVVFASYQVTDPTIGPGDRWRALINFGDGQVDGPLIPVPEGGGFAFIDSHTYRAAGTYTVTVMIAVPGSHQPNDNTVTTTATVTAGSSAPTSPTPTSPRPPVAIGIGLRAGEGRAFHGPVARVIGPGVWARQLTALISWGDQSPPEAGRIRGVGRGRFRVVGSHAYAQPGSFRILVTIRDASGAQLLAESRATVRAHR